MWNSSIKRSPTAAVTPAWLLVFGVALLMLNTVFSEQKTIKSIFGLEETTTTTEEVVSFDLYNNLNQ